MSMRVLCWGTYDVGKPRTRILHEGLRRAGADVAECHVNVWRGVEDKSQVRSRIQRLRLLLRWVACYPALIWRFMRVQRPEAVLIGYPGILDALVIIPFARLRGVPVVWDMFMSTYDTVVLDRRLLRPTSFLARVLRAVEGFAVRRCDLVFLDTEAHARRIEALFGLPAGSVGAVWVGAELEHFGSACADGGSAPRADGPLRVLFYGQFIPLHGIQTIIDTARLMADEPVEWTLIGRGQEAEAVSRQLAQGPLPRLHWIDWVDYSGLQRWICGSDLCLGIFGTSDKAASVIPNKVFQIVASGRPVVTRDSPAIRELLAHCPPCVYLVPAADPHALAAVIRAHARGTSGSPCHGALRERIGAAAIGQQFTRLIEARREHIRKREASDAR